MVTVSLCMIVKNEEAVLARCLDSVKSLVDEIVIVDTGSTDRTKEIASRYTDQVYDFTWIDDFSAARNFSFSKAKMMYCLWLDADDLLLPQDQTEFLSLKRSLSPDVDIVMMKYHVAFDQNGVPTYSYYRERLIRRLSGFCWKGEVHEAISLGGKVEYSEIGITHQKLGQGDVNRNLNIFEKLMASGKKLEPRQRFYYGRELFYHHRWLEAIDTFDGFLKEGRGWIENNIDACRLLSACYLELGNEEEGLRRLFQSFIYASPRAEVCCDIGAVFMRWKKWEQAIYWYQQALHCMRDDRSGGFVMPDCYGYIPALQLCVCYDKLGDIETACRYNELAGQLHPESEAYLFNRKYFAGLGIVK